MLNRTAAIRRLQKHNRESGIYDRSTGRKVVEKKRVLLDNFQPRIEVLPAFGDENENGSDTENGRSLSTEDKARTRLAGYSYDKSKLRLDDRRCVRFVRMLKTGTPRHTVEKLMKKALGDEGFEASLLDNWQNKLVSMTRQPHGHKKRGRETAQAYQRKPIGFQETRTSAVDQHELEMISRKNRSVQMVVLYVIYLLQKQEGRVRDLFAKIDLSGDGSLSSEEFSRGLIQLGFSLRDEETKFLFKAIDDDDSGEIELREFVRLLRQPLASVKLSHIELADALRRLEVVISQEHAVAVHKKLVDEDPSGNGLIAPDRLHALVMDREKLAAIDPNKGALSLHPQDVLNRPKHNTYRFSNPLLSDAALEMKEMKASQDRALLHKTVQRLSKALIASAWIVWKSKVIECGLKDLRKKQKSSRLSEGLKNKPLRTREQQSKAKQRELIEKEPDLTRLDETANKGDLAKCTTISSRVKQRILARKRAERQKMALERLQKELDTKLLTLDGRPRWDSPALFPYRYQDMNPNEIPCLARMFKNHTFWSKHCNPKVKASPRTRRLKQASAPKHDKGLVDINYQIQAFTSQAETVSREFRKLENFNRPTPEPGGYYQAPAGPRKAFPELDKFFKGGKAKDLIRAFQRIPAQLSS